MKYIKNGTEQTVEEVFLRNIGVKSLDEINDWFRKSYANAYRIDYLGDAVELCKQFINDFVTIIGDYDVDGVCSVKILYTTLAMMGFKNIKYIIPDRISEGFGINPSIVDKIDKGLIITCDNGIAGIEAIKKAKEKGLTVIVIDHHEPVKDEQTKEVILPDADIIIDPNAISDSADFNGYCGAGLSYRFAVEMLQDKQLYAPLQIYAAIATICDVMELKAENYVIVRNGLQKMKYSSLCTKGLYALICQYNLDKNITAHDIGFKIGPALNAPGRLLQNGANISVELLNYDENFATAITMAEELVNINERRKELKKEALKMAEQIMKDTCLYGDNPLTLYIPSIEEGIVGIISGNLTEKYKVPSFVFTDAEEEGCLKGSGRSCSNYDMKANMDKCPELFVKYGGHEGAGGMTIKKENLEILRETLINNNTGFIELKINEIRYDLEIKASQVSKTIEELAKYEPFGEGNPPIVFKVTGFEVVPRMGKYKTYMGSDASIVKLFGKKMDAIGFDMADRFANIEKPKKITLYGTLSNNYFKGEVTPQIEFFDFELEEMEMIQTSFAERLSGMAAERFSNMY